MSRAPSPSRAATLDPHAFSLVELLVTVAIIATLAGIALPILQRSQLSAKQTACASNLRQIGLALHAYAAENEDRLPLTSHSASGTGTWIFTLAPYLANIDKVRICPADPKGRERLAANGTSYILNSYLFVPTTDPFGNPVGGPTNDLSAIRNPSQTMMAFIVADSQPAGATSDHTHSTTWTSWSAVTRDIAPDRFTTSRRADFSNGAANYLFADGHVESFRAAAIKARIESGDNIALPR